MIEIIRVALGGLTANKLRSGLTILGMTIGVGSVIVLIAVGTGSSAAVTNQIDALGTNVLLVSGAPTLGGLFRGGGGASASAGSGLTVADANALVNRFQAPDVLSASPVVNANSVTLTSGTTTYSAVVVRRHDPLVRGGPQLHDGRRLVVHGRPGPERTLACSWSGRLWSASCSAAPIRSARRSRSTARTSRSSA